MMNLLIRADVGPTVGVGHVMRTAALAAQWQRLGGRSTMVCETQLPTSLKSRLTKMGLDVRLIESESLLEDAVQLKHFATQLSAEWIVLDGYRFTDEYQEIAKTSRARLLVLDDYGHASHKAADFVLNQNVYANPSGRSKRELLGPQYSLMRDEFEKVKSRRVPRVAKRVLVTMGGADHENVTQLCLEAFNELQSNLLSFDIVVGSCNPHFDSLKSYAKLNHMDNVRFHRNVTRMSALFELCDLAIAAAGSTCYELARCSVPTLTISTAENQIPVAQAFDELGCMKWLGHADQLNSGAVVSAVQPLIRGWQRREEMVKRGNSIVDGQGAARVARRLYSSAFEFREATSSDSSLLLKWRNEAFVRQNSFSSNVVTAEEHDSWFSNVLQSQSDLWIVENQSEPIAQVRMDFDQRLLEATISISLDAKVRGQGWGTLIIEKACRQVFNSDDVDEIVAMIKPDNSASVRAFEKAGFVKENEIAIRNQAARRFVLRRESSSTSSYRQKRSA